jgi:hypothetical protein
MANKNKKMSTKSQNNSIEMKNTLQTIQKKEFWIGLVTLAAFIFVAARVLPFQKLNPFTANKTRTVMSPVPSLTKAQIADTTVSVTPVVTTIVTPMAPTKAVAMKQPNDSKLKKVSALADTNGLYVVEEGDSYYTISVKACGTGIYFESIQYQNEGKPLHHGDTVTVICTE